MDGRLVHLVDAWVGRAAGRLDDRSVALCLESGRDCHPLAWVGELARQAEREPAKFPQPVLRKRVACRAAVDEPPWVVHLAAEDVLVAPA
jgi:hypothetical protein